MSRLPLAFQFVLLMFSGWVNHHQVDVMEYLQEENRVLKERLGGRRLCFTDIERRRLTRRRKHSDIRCWVSFVRSKGSCHLLHLLYRHRFPIRTLELLLILTADGRHRARYDTIIELLRLKASGGSLSVADIDEVNALLDR